MALVTILTINSSFDILFIIFHSSDKDYSFFPLLLYILS